MLTIVAYDKYQQCKLAKGPHYTSIIGFYTVYYQATYNANFCRAVDGSVQSTNVLVAAWLTANVLYNCEQCCLLISVFTRAESSSARVIAMIACLSVSHAGIVSKLLNVGSRT